MREETGTAQNLIAQIDKIYKNCNEKGFQTRARYYEATKRFCRFTAEEFKSQKFANTQPKHIRSYVEHLYENGASGNTVRTELSGIRFFYERSGGTNVLPDNNELGIPSRQVGECDRAWLPEEIKKACTVADRTGRTDVKIYIRTSLCFGLRIEEACKLRVEHLERALNNQGLWVKGKGGRERTVPVETEHQRKLLVSLYRHAKRKGLLPGDYLISDNKKRGVEREKASITSWIDNHRKEFTDPDRTLKVKPGEKPRSQTISGHGLRYCYAQDADRRLNAQGMNEERILHEISARLGHNRPAITYVYLSRYSPAQLKKRMKS